MHAIATHVATARVQCTQDLAVRPEGSGLGLGVIYWSAPPASGLAPCASRSSIASVLDAKIAHISAVPFGKKPALTTADFSRWSCSRSRSSELFPSSSLTRTFSPSRIAAFSRSLSVRTKSDSTLPRPSS